MCDLKKIAAANNKDYTDVQKSHQNNIEKLIDIGDRLIIAQDEFDTGDEFSGWVERTHPFKIVQARRYIRIAAHKAQARIEAKRDPELNVNDLQKLLPRSSEEPLPTEADVNQLGYVGAKPGTLRDADNWHTPVEYIEAARRVMGSIDLDPFSDNLANERVKAERILTIADDALTCTWADPTTRTVWLNPPYSAGLSSKAVDKFIEEYNYGSFDQAIVLMNSSTDTNWFHRMATICTALCFTKGRIAFIADDGKKSSGNTKGQVFFYIGNDIEVFRTVFSVYGLVLPHTQGGSL